MTTSHDSLVHALEASHAELHARVLAFSGDEATRRVPGKGFCLVEHVCHLRDLEVEGYGLRLRRVLTEDLPDLDELDGARIAAERSYERQDLQAAWRDFARQRQLNLALLRAQLPRHAQRKGLFGATGIVTLEGLARAMQRHDRDHLKELGELRAGLGAAPGPGAAAPGILAGCTRNSSA